MRTTLDIEDDVLLATKELAQRGHTTAGKVISDLVRRALTQPVTADNGSADRTVAVHGFRPFPSRGGLVTNELVDRLRDEHGV